MKNRKAILFFGELPPKIFHGISLSNERILSALSKGFDIYKVEDDSSFGGRFFALYSFFVSVLKLIYLSSKKINIYYVNTPLSYLGLWKVYLSVLVVKAFSPRVKVISHLHRGDFLVFVKTIRNRHLFLRFSNCIDVILVLSNSAAAELKDSTLIGEHKVEVLHNTVTVLTDKDAILAKDGNNSTERYFYCLCNYIPTKRIHSLVEIANQIPLSIFRFNGASINEQYMNRLEVLNVNSICRFYGVVNGKDKERKLSASKALVLPSLNEGMPLVILESLAQATPVICFDIGYVSDYLGENYPGLVKELTDDALKEKIQWLEQLSSEEYLSLRAQSFSIFWNYYDSNIINESTLRIFNRL